MDYTCKRCGYNTFAPSILKKHLSSLRVCRPVLLDISREELLSELPNKTTYILNSITYKCNKCAKEFNSQGNRSRHQTNCTVEPEKTEIKIINTTVTNLQGKFDKLQETLEKLTVQLTNSNSNIETKPEQIMNQLGDNNTNTIVNDDHSSVNTVNIINITEPYHIDHLRNVQLMYAISDIKEAVPTFIGNVVFNPEKPDNQNVKFLGKKYSEVRTNDKWVKQPADKVFREMATRMLETYYRYLKENSFTQETMLKYVADSGLPKENLLLFLKELEECSKYPFDDPERMNIIAEDLCNQSANIHRYLPPKVTDPEFKTMRL